MTISQKGIDFIKQFEGFRSEAYQDSGGIWTIGYGTIKYHNGLAVKKGDTINLNEAESELIYEIQAKTKLLNALKLTFNQNQYDAVSSFIYNVGFNAFFNSTMRKLMDVTVNDPTIKDQFLRWSYDNGKFIQGLFNRRTLEANLYFT